MQLVRPTVGSRAPQLAIASPSPKTADITWQSFMGSPVVLAFVDDWSPARAGSEAIHALRRELTGLSAALLIVSAERVWCFRPDDAIEQYSPLPARSSDGIFESYGVDVHGLSAGDVSLFLIDGAGVVRCARIASAGERATDTLVYALTMAGCKLMAARARGIPLPRRELVMLGLVSAFSLLFPDAWASDGLTALGV